MTETKKKSITLSKTVSTISGIKSRKSNAGENRIKSTKRIRHTGEKIGHLVIKQNNPRMQPNGGEIKKPVSEKNKGAETNGANQKILEEVIACAGGPVFSVDKKYCYTSFNKQHAKAMKMLYGTKIEIGHDLLEYHTNLEDRTQVKKNIARALRGETVLAESYAGEKAQARHYYEIAHYPLRGSNNKVKGVTVYARDITVLKTREEENQRIAQTIMTLSNSNQAMMRARNETEYMEEVCRNIENDCGYAMVWIGLAEKDKDKSVRPVISAGFEDGYLDNANISWADTERGRGPTGTAIRTGKVSLCKNMLTDPKFIPWRKEASKHGYASSIALPLIAGEKPFGALTIYSKMPDAFSIEEVKLLAELASDLAYGITAFRLRAEQINTENALREKGEQLRYANELLELVTEGTGVFIATQDTSLRYTYFNHPYKEEIKNLTGKDIQIGSSMADVFADLPEQQEVAVKEWNQVLQGNSFTKTLEFGDPGRYRRIYNTRHTPLCDDHGNIIGAGEVGYDISEQEHAKIALAQSETRYQNLFNRMIEGFAVHEIICDKKGIPCDYRFLDVNPAFEKLTGLKRDNIIGKTHNEVLPGDPPKWVEIYGKVALCGEPVQFENYSPALKRHYAVNSFQPEPGKFAVIFQDISERKSLEEKQNWLASFPEHNPYPVIEVDYYGNVHYLNPAARTALPKLQERGKKHPYLNGLEGVIALYKKGETRPIIRDVKVGDLVYRQTISIIADSERIRIYSINITAAINAEQALRQSRDLLETRVKERTKELVTANEQLRMAYAYNRSLIEASLDPLVTITLDGKIGDVNKATEVVTGCTRGELIGTDFHNYFVDPERARAGYQKVFDTGMVHDYNLEIRKKDGSHTPVVYNASVYRDETGKVKGVFAVARDITERKQFETQLVQAEKHAIIGRMVGSITHEINNPLQTIKNCLYLIQQEVTPESPIQEPLEMAASETLRLTNLVGHLRELYRPKPGINKQSNEILDIVEEVHSLLVPHLNSARVEWQPLKGLQRCYVECVRDQILEVFLNISMNAIEAMQSKGGTIFVDMIKAEERIAVIFKDTGPGITEEIAQHIFEPFMTTKASGLGLGLSISYGIVQRHGGQIIMENQPGQGATFTIWLPQNS
jgi:PAS domain S-box-containing protein